LRGVTSRLSSRPLLKLGSVLEYFQAFGSAILVSRSLPGLCCAGEVFPKTLCDKPELRFVRYPLIPLPSPSEFLTKLPAWLVWDWYQLSASLGVLFPSAYLRQRSLLTPGLPHPARSARKVSHLLSGLLLLCLFWVYFTPVPLLGFSLQGFPFW
jgi:hypothetical protein